MFSNKLYALGMLGALALSLQYTDASEDLQAQQTTVSGSSPPSSPGKFSQGMNFITSGFKNTFNRVTGGRLFAKEKETETVVMEVTPSTVSKTTDPSGPEKIESIPLSHVEAPYSPKAEELESKAVYVNENELGINKVVEIEKIETQEHVQTPPIARVSELEESRNDELLANVDDNTIVVDSHSPDLHHYDANGGSMQAGPRPIAYPSKLGESGDDERLHDDSSPLEEIQETIYNHDSPEVPENMKNRPIAHLTKSGEEEGDMSMVIDKNDVSDTSKPDEELENMKNRPIVHLTKSGEEEGDMSLVVDKIDISDTSKAVNVRTNVDELSMLHESGQREFQNHQSLDAEDALKLNYGMVDYEHESRQYDKNEAFLNVDNLHTPKAKLSESSSKAEEDVREYEQKDVSYDDRISAASQSMSNPPIAYLSNYEYEVEHDQLLNEKGAIQLDEVPHIGDTSASERTTSIFDSSVLEVLENKSLESEKKVIIHQDTSHYDSDARVSPNLMVPIADNSDMAEEKRALASADLSRELENVSPEDTFQPLITTVPHVRDTFTSEKTTSIVDSSPKLDEVLENKSLESEEKIIIQQDTSRYDSDARISPNLMVPVADNSDVAEENRAVALESVTFAADQSRMRESENVSPEDTFQPFTDVIHLQDESQYHKNGAYTFTEIHDFSGGIREENTAHTSSRVPLTVLSSDELKFSDHENVFQVEEKNIKNEYRYDKEELSSSTRVSGVDYPPVHAKMPETVMVS